VQSFGGGDKDVWGRLGFPTSSPVTISMVRGGSRCLSRRLVCSSPPVVAIAIRT
jgi:hypothetical protein